MTTTDERALLAAIAADPADAISALGVTLAALVRGATC